MVARISSHLRRKTLVLTNRTEKSSPKVELQALSIFDCLLGALPLELAEDFGYLRHYFSADIRHHNIFDEGVLRSVHFHLL